MRQLWLDVLVSSSTHGKNELMCNTHKTIYWNLRRFFDMDSDAAEKTRNTMRREEKNKMNQTGT